MGGERMKMLYQSELAERLGVARCVVCNWLNGKHKPSLKYLPKLQKMGFKDLEIWGDRARIQEYLYKNEMSALLLPKNAKRVVFKIYII